MPICVFILLILHLYVFESTMNKQRSITFTFTWHQPGILQLLVPSGPATSPGHPYGLAVLFSTSTIQYLQVQVQGCNFTGRILSHIQITRENFTV